MAQLGGEAGDSGKKGKHHKKRAKKFSARIDMTPMVDPAFLLLTFFVLTSTFSKPKTMEITYPVDPKDTTKQMKIDDETALTLLLGEKTDKIYYYKGKFKPDVKVETTNYSKDGIRKILLDRNKDVIEKIKLQEQRLLKREIADTTFKRIVSKDIKGARDAVFVIVKTDEKTKYKNVIDVLDEINICDVGKYAVVDMAAPEKEMIKNL